MALDHGVLNVPLAKRGDIDRQLDAFKAEQARAASAKRKADAAHTAELRKQAKALVAATTPEQWKTIGARINESAASTRRIFKSQAHWGPANVIASLTGWGVSA